MKIAFRDCVPWLVVLAALAVTGCQHSVDRSWVVSSLRPVDSARPMVVFSQVQGKACGNDALLGALRDMKRLIGVDGYLEVVVHETATGTERCVQTTAYPFRYGTSTVNPVVNAGQEGTEPVSIPGRPAAPTPVPTVAAEGGTGPGAAPVFDCAEACQRYASLVESGSIKIALAKDRCEQRCKQPDNAFQKCIASAHEASTAKACMAP